MPFFRLQTTSHLSLHRIKYVAPVIATALLVLFVSGAHQARSSSGWRGDYETGDFSQWVWGVQQKAAGRATIVQSPLRQGRYAARFEVRSGDNNVAGSGNGERTEALIDQSTTDASEGREQWWAWSTMFGADYQANYSDWNDFIQFHSGTTSPASHFSAFDNYIQLRVFGGSQSNPSDHIFRFENNRQNGVWYDFVFHVKWSSDPGVGFLELFENGRRVIPMTHLATLYAGHGVYLKEGIYRNAQPYTSVLYQDGMRRVSSYQDAIAGFPAGTWPSSIDGSAALATPTIDGSPVVGKSLTATVDTASLTSSVADTLAYQWRLCDASGSSCHDIAGADTASYTVAPSDVGSTFRVVASVETSTGTISSTSDATALVASTATALPLPTVSGTAEVGDDLTAALDTTSLGASMLSLAYQWQSCAVGGSACSDIGGASTSRYTVSTADIGTALRVRASVKTSTGLLTSTSLPTTVVPAIATAQSSTGVSSSISDGQTLTGSLAWTASVSGFSAAHVDFSIDGSNTWRENLAPYVFDGDHAMLDTTALPDGLHVFKVVAYRSDGSSVAVSATARVANSTPSATSLSVSSSIGNGQTLSGRVPWTVEVGGGTATKVEFYIDGSPRWTENIAPYVFNGTGGTLDTTTLSDGNHIFSVKVYASDGSTTSATATAMVSNTAVSPPPPAAGTLSVDSSISNGAKLSGQVTWTAQVTGDVQKVEFYVDGSLESTEKIAPYVFGGDGGKLDTADFRNGKHTLVVKATGSDGSTASATADVQFRR